MEEWTVDWFVERKINPASAQKLVETLNNEELSKELLLEEGRDGAAKALTEIGIPKGQQLIILRQLFGSAQGVSPPSSPNPSLTKAEIIATEGIYQLLREVKKGGEGIVYEGRRSTDGTRVAIKKLNGEGDERRQFNEISIMLTLDHPHIARVLDCYIDQESRRPVMVMPWYNSSLFDFVRRDKARTPADIIEWTRQAAEGLVYLHSKGIAHRDLKGSNMLVEVTKDEKKVISVHLTDFGMSLPTDIDAEVIEATSVLGTPGYIAPEINSTQEGYDPFLSDMFALGRTIYEMVKGKQPDYRGNTLTKSPDDGDDLKLLIHLSDRCCQKDPKKRPTAQQILQAIQEHRNPLPTMSYEHLVGMLERKDWDNLEAFSNQIQNQLGNKRFKEAESIMQKMAHDWDIETVADRIMETMKIASPQHWKSLLFVASTICILGHGYLLADDGAIHKVINAMQQGDLDVKRGGCFFLQWYLYNVEESSDLDHMVIPLMSAIKDHPSNSDIQRWAWQSIGSLVATPSDYIDRCIAMIIEEDVVLCAIRNLRNFQENQVWECTADGLSNIILQKETSWMKKAEMAELDDLALACYISANEEPTRDQLMGLIGQLPWPSKWKLNIADIITGNDKVKLTRLALHFRATPFTLDQVETMLHGGDLPTVAGALVKKMDEANSIQDWICILCISCTTVTLSRYSVALAKKGAVAKIIGAMQLYPFDTEIQWTACRLIAYCVFYDKSPITEEIIVPIMTTIRQHPSDIQVQRNGFYALEVMGCDQKGVNLMVSRGLVTCAKNGLNMNDDYIWGYVAKTLNNVGSVETPLSSEKEDLAELVQKMQKCLAKCKTEFNSAKLTEAIKCLSSK